MILNSAYYNVGDALSVDFETKLYSDSMDVLEHHLKPPEKIAGVVLEQVK